MINKLQQKLWSMGRLVCPECYCRLHDYDYMEDCDLMWYCHHCEYDVWQPGFVYYWPLGMIKPRIKYLAKTLCQQIKGLQS